jgi:hypothetical protein
MRNSNKPSGRCVVPVELSGSYRHIASERKPKDPTKAKRKRNQPDL